MQALKSNKALSGHGVRCNRVRRNNVVAVRAAKTADGPRVAIVGVTGAVGQEFLTVSCKTVCFILLKDLTYRTGRYTLSQVLKERNFPYSELKLLASARCRPLNN